MIGAIRRRLSNWWVLHGHRVQDLHPAAKVPWSSIRRVGQSRLLALTIVVPFLGSLLLFNQYVVDLFTLSPDVVKRLTSGGEEGGLQFSLNSGKGGAMQVRKKDLLVIYVKVHGMRCNIGTQTGCSSDRGGNACTRGLWVEGRL